MYVFETKIGEQKKKLTTNHLFKLRQKQETMWRNWSTIDRNFDVVLRVELGKDLIED